MKILMIGATASGSGDAPLLLKKAFELQNCEVLFVSANEDRPFFTNIIFGVTKQINKFILINFGRYIFRLVDMWRPDVVFIYGSNPWVSASVIKNIKNKRKCKVVLWEVNNFCFRGYQAESIPYYDAVFTLDSYLLPLLHVNGVKNAYYLPACIDPEEHFPIILNEEDRARFSADISMMGSPYPTRVGIVQNLTGYNLRVYGSGWKKYPQMVPFVFDAPILDLGKLKVFSASRISLNIHGPHMINGENYRVFEAAACAAACFSLYKPDLVKCFEPEKEVILFENIEDLHTKIDYYLAHPEKLQEVAVAAHRRVLAEHTYHQRVDMILKTIM